MNWTYRVWAGLASAGIVGLGSTAMGQGVVPGGWDVQVEYRTLQVVGASQPGVSPHGLALQHPGAPSAIAGMGLEISPPQVIRSLDSLLNPVKRTTRKRPRR